MKRLVSVIEEGGFQSTKQFLKGYFALKTPFKETQAKYTVVINLVVDYRPQRTHQKFLGLDCFAISQMYVLLKRR